ncbi:MFS general substrate transporter [Lecanosticta acicola]|uniref:MFS general substrate transporter n=1 Tax=Lecanosticta acicola TaxID=111012 RepID=A0AAI8Z1L1_9PEZI|nr:MFS general substrate transporter [Lecanosticta acicola]
MEDPTAMPLSAHNRRETIDVDEDKIESGNGTPAARDDGAAKTGQQHSEDDIPLYMTFSPAHEFVFVCLLCCTQLLTQAALGQTLVPLHIIGESLGTSDPAQLSWMAAAYSLTVGTFVLPAGRLGDMLGPKTMVVIGWSWFGLFSTLVGLSVYAAKGNAAVIMFCVSQGIRGIGPAILLPNALAICGRSYPNGRRKDVVFALFAMTAPSGFWIGGIFASIFSQFAWWPWSFWSMGITATGLAFGAYFVIPDEKEAHNHGQKFDYIGTFLGVSGLVLFNFAWNQATVVTWASAYVCVLLIVGLLLLVAFVFYQTRISHPLLPIEIFSFGTVSILVIVGLGWASFGVFIFYTVQILETIRTLTPVETCVQLITLALGGCIAALSTGLSIRHIPAPWLLMIAATSFMVGNILSATMGARQTYWAETFVAFIIISFGMDISFPASTLILSDMAPRNLQGIAASLANTVINYSVSLGLGVAGTAELQVDPDSESLLHGYRIALWVAVGMAGLALLIAACFALYAHNAGLNVTEPRERKKECSV